MKITTSILSFLIFFIPATGKQMKNLLYVMIFHAILQKEVFLPYP